MKYLPEKIIKGVAYSRVSTVAQASEKGGIYRQDSSPEIQKLRMSEYVKNKSDKGEAYKIVHYFEDVGFSGKNTKRPGFKNLEKLIVSKEIDFVIVTDLSRLSRSLLDFLSFMSLCNKYGVSLIVLNQHIDTLTPQGKFSVNTMMAMYQFEREITGQRVSQNALTRLRNNGKINGAKEILGLDKIENSSRKGHFQINNSEASILVKIFNEFLNHGSKKLTYDFIQREKIEWKPNIPFTRQRFDLMFKMIHSRYRGVYPTDLGAFEEFITGKNESENYEMVNLPHGPVVEIELLDKVASKLKTQSNKIRCNKRGGYVYPLSGLLFSQDGIRFQGQPSKQLQYRYYYNPQDKVRIRCDELEAVVLDRFRDYLNDEKLLKNLVSKTKTKQVEKKSSYEEELKNLETQKFKLLSEKDELIRKVISLSSDQNLLTVVQELNLRLEKIVSELSELENESSRISELKNQFVTDLNTDELELILKDVYKKINKLSNESKRDFLF